jgi:hypothetical protein
MVNPVMKLSQSVSFNITSACMLASLLLIVSRISVALGKTASELKAICLGAAASQMLVCPLLILSIFQPGWRSLQASIISVGLCILFMSPVVFDRASAWAKFATVALAVLGLLIIVSMLLAGGQS